MRGRESLFANQVQTLADLAAKRTSQTTACSNRLNLMRWGSTAVVAQAALLVFLVGLEVAFEPFDVAVALEGQDVGGQAVEEEAVVADDHGAAGEILQRLFQRRRVSTSRSLVGSSSSSTLPPSLSILARCTRLRSPPDSRPTFFCWSAPLKLNAADIGAGRDLHLVAELHDVEAAGDLLPDVLLVVQVVAALVDVAELDGVAELDRAGVRLLLAGDHLEQGRLAGAVRADHADDAAGRQLEGQVLEQQLVAVGLATGPRPRSPCRRGAGRAGSGSAPCRSPRGSAFLGQLVEGADARLRLGLPRLGRGADPLQLALDRALLGLLLALFLASRRLAFCSSQAE